MVLFFVSPGKLIRQTIIKIKTYARETQIKKAHHVSMLCTPLPAGWARAFLPLRCTGWVKSLHHVLELKTPLGGGTGLLPHVRACWGLPKDGFASHLQVVNDAGAVELSVITVSTNQAPALPHALLKSAVGKPRSPFRSETEVDCTGSGTCCQALTSTFSRFFCRALSF